MLVLLDMSTIHNQYNFHSFNLVNMLYMSVNKAVSLSHHCLKHFVSYIKTKCFKRENKVFQLLEQI